jgi:hypothetical protein
MMLIYYSGDKIEKNEMGGDCSTYGERRGVYRVLVGNHERKRPFKKHRRRRKNNYRMDLQEVGCGNMDWIGVAQNRDRLRALVNAAMNLWVS